MPPSAYGTRPWLSSYPPGVPADVEVPDVALTSLLDAATRRHPHGAALTYLGRRFTWAELDAEVDRFARGLTGAGVGPGDRVAVLLPNCPQNVVTFWAALRVGAVVVELNMLSPAPELQGQLADCGARLVVTLDQAFDVVAQVRDSGVTRLTDIVVTSMTEYRPLLDRISLRLPLPGAHRGRRKVAAWDSGEPGVRAFRSLLEGPEGPRGHTEGHGQDHSQPSWPLVDPQDPAVLQYTNGTTGAPRAAVLSHRNLVANALQCRAWLPQLGEGSERVVAVLPLHHVYGLMLSLVYPTAIAATVLLLPRFDLEELLEVIEHDRPGLLPVVPPILRAIVDDPRSRSRDLSGLRLAVSGAMRLPVGVAQRFERLAGCPVVEGYGTAETSPVTHVNPVPEPAPADPSAAVAQSAARPTLSIGLPLPSTEARIVALEDPAMEVPVGQPGELAIRGPQVFRGYWRDEEQTRQVLHDGWLLTGDVARMEPDGLFYLVDRKRDLIVSGGYKVQPAEVEAVLAQLPWVREVAVVGVPDRHRGETVKAYVVVDAAERRCLGPDAAAVRTPLPRTPLPRTPLPGPGPSSTSPKRGWRPTRCRVRWSFAPHCREPGTARSRGGCCRMKRSPLPGRPTGPRPCSASLTWTCWRRGCPAGSAEPLRWPRRNGTTEDLEDSGTDAGLGRAGQPGTNRSSRFRAAIMDAEASGVEGQR